VKHKYLAIYSR